MKNIFSLFILILAFNNSFAQVVESEKIDWENLPSLVVESEKIEWENLPSFSADTFIFKSEQFNYSCTDCRYVEIKTLSGVSGYFLLGPSDYSIPKKKMNGRSTAFMIRMNPKDSTKFLQIKNPLAMNDDGFVAVSLLVLNDIFKRCYHSGQDALIPQRGDYTLDIFSDKEGDILFIYADGKEDVIYVTKRKKR